MLFSLLSTLLIQIKQVFTWKWELTAWKVAAVADPKTELTGLLQCIYGIRKWLLSSTPPFEHL